MTSATFLHLNLGPANDAPIYRQIYERIRGAVLAGELPPGARLPSARSLASQLVVARGTVESAYQLLAGEGYIVGRGAAGSFVDTAAVGRIAPPPRPTRDASDASQAPHGTAPLLFRMGVPALDAFPRKLWARLVARAGRGQTSSDLDYPDPAGLPSLRRSIAAYLRVARGVACTAEQIVITTGYQGALAILARVLLQPGAAVWVEDPGYLFGRRALALAGACLVPVPVDRAGIDVAAGRATAPEARLAVVTPCHHFPFGATLPVARRMALLDWAEAAGAYIVEDDYDSEFRYRGRPLPALKSIDLAQRVLYAGTFSKVIYPALRMGYLVVPEALVARFRETVAAFQPAPPAIDQSIVAAFIDGGHFARHIRRMRGLYGERRLALAEALETACGGRLVTDAPAGGMHLVARLNAGHDEAAVLALAQALGLSPAPLSSCGIAAPAGPGLLIGFTNVPATAAREAAARLAAAMAP
jgi:GntR family transcriptional regulator/MocR family aminotransferase